jgi:uncharacterized cofD-like protein
MKIGNFLSSLGAGALSRIMPGKKAGKTVAHPEENRLWETLYQRYCDNNGPSIAAIGGGTGLAMLLRGLKKYSSNLSAIVNVTDDGGSSGRLRENLDMLPPGDIRNCLLALADTEPLLEKVFQYRFTAGEGLEGHNLGNLFLAALTEQFGFEGAVIAASKVLAVKGDVLPVTLAKLNLVALFTNGCEVYGESQIPLQHGRIVRLRLEPETSYVYPVAEKAILDAEIVVVGPGSLYTSILANLLVPGVSRAIRESSARKVYICNVMTQPGETDGFSAADHLQVIYDHVGTGLFDTVIINNSLQIPQSIREKYLHEGSSPVVPDTARLRKMGVNIVAADLLSPHELVRHNPDRLAHLVLQQVTTFRDKGVSAFSGSYEFEEARGKGCAL